ncbi:TetR/AcrR family transcriptional regulator [Microbacterium sp.]|uniref:TetR/AcrR family transcriptional regulator n=1 Tax=Microbacterium sp. TaxID=51671 RepID=UPI00281281D0|nr:helix-turn-helix domain-containing protein [Microbacterium sp.]
MSDKPRKSTPVLRADAERNREAVVAAAREVFAESGSSASMNEVARRAGVNIATLFRRFPTRSRLIAAAYAEKMALYVAAIERALDDPEGWRGFRAYLETAFEMQAGDCAFTDVLTMSFPDVPEFMREQRRAGSLLPELVERARATGRLRPDFVHQDVALLLLAIAGVANATRHTAPNAWRRVATLSIDAIQTGREVLPEPPTVQQLYRTFAHERIAARPVEDAAQPNSGP